MNIFALRLRAIESLGFLKSWGTRIHASSKLELQFLDKVESGSPLLTASPTCSVLVTGTYLIIRSVLYIVKCSMVCEQSVERLREKELCVLMFKSTHRPWTLNTHVVRSTEVHMGDV